MPLKLNNDIRILINNIRLLNDTLRINGYSCCVDWVEKDTGEFVLLVKKDEHKISFYEGPLKKAITVVLDIHNFILSYYFLLF